MSVEKKEKRSHMMGFKASDKERDRIVKFCEENDTTISLLIRYAVTKLLDEDE